MAEDPIEMFPFFEAYCYVINGLAISFNFILLVLSSHKSIEAIQELRYFLSNISIAGIIYSTCVLLLQPRMVTRGTMTIRVPLGPANYLGDYHCKLIASTAITFYLYGMLSFPLFFVYRTMILINSTSWGQYFNKKNLVFTLLIVFLGSCVEGLFFYYSNISYSDLYERLNRTTNITTSFNEMNKHIATTASLGTTGPATGQTGYSNISGVSYSEDTVKRLIPVFGDDYSRNPLILYFHGISFGAHTISYIVILISAHFMLKTLKLKQGTISRDTLLANEVLVHAIFAEAFLPLLLAVPVAANAILTFFYENSLEWQEFLPAYCISLVPLLSPLTSIGFIRPYRHTMKYALTFGFLRKTQQSQDANVNEN